MMPVSTTENALERVVGIPGAVLMGLGSIVGTGLFVSLGIAAGIAGPAVVLAVILAALVATCNGLSSAQLAASHPVSGGTYEYGYRYLGSYPGFTAGWMFLCAKSASAATAALGFSGYLFALFGKEPTRWELRWVALALVASLTILVMQGMRRSNRVNAAIVSFTILALAAYVLVGAPNVARHPEPFLRVGEEGIGGLLHATALMFVAYTGYGRVATLGEEVRDPGRSVPIAIVATLVCSLGLYVAVAVVSVAAMGAEGLAGATRSTAAPLEAAARMILPGLDVLLALAAVTAMVGVSLNLLLGLSRVVLAMARRSDLPSGLSRIDGKGQPSPANLVTGMAIAILVLIGNVKTTWSFSAFTVLIYYAITNMAALRLPPEQRRFPRWVAVLGLGSCLGLAFWVDPVVWAVGLGLIGAGLCWHFVARRLRLT